MTKHNLVTTKHMWLCFHVFAASVDNLVNMFSQFAVFCAFACALLSCSAMSSQGHCTLGFQVNHVLLGESG